MKKKTLCSCPVCKSGKCGICRAALYGDDGMTIKDHGLIRSEQDIMKLNIIDWKRHEPWPNPQAAMHTIFSWFNNMAHYTILEEDLTQCPERDDFPGWNHVGGHESYGKLYWNWFQHWHGQNGWLRFSDSPDFYGKLDDRFFWGDVGQCSPQALAHVQKQMSANDLWISVRSANIQIIIEPTVDLIELFAHLWNHQEPQETKEILAPLAKTHIQLNLFD